MKEAEEKESAGIRKALLLVGDRKQIYNMPQIPPFVEQEQKARVSSVMSLDCT